jgi:hypothetical protein
MRASGSKADVNPLCRLTGFITLVPLDYANQGRQGQLPHSIILLRDVFDGRFTSNTAAEAVMNPSHTGGMRF